MKQAILNKLDWNILTLPEALKNTFFLWKESFSKTKYVILGDPMIERHFAGFFFFSNQLYFEFQNKITQSKFLLFSKEVCKAMKSDVFALAEFLLPG